MFVRLPLRAIVAPSRAIRDRRIHPGLDHPPSGLASGGRRVGVRALTWQEQIIDNARRRPKCPGRPLSDEELRRVGLMWVARVLCRRMYEASLPPEVLRDLGQPPRRDQRADG